MARFANWTQLSETTFLLRPVDPTADYRLRIFTPSGELPFAGHPTLGSARAWLEIGNQPASGDQLLQECGAGLVAIKRQGSRLAFQAPPLRRGGPVDRQDIDRVSAALGLEPGRILDAQWADNGPGWMALLLADAASVLSIDRPSARLRADDSIGVIGAYPPGAPADFEVRAFVGGSGPGEDPVTGSLNASIGQWLIPGGLAPASYVVSQGTRLGRNGRVYVESRDGEVWIGGDTVIGVTGSVDL
jgi:PhzF family phenazine biosynthesis protein